jgi:hypothetical protein
MLNCGQVVYDYTNRKVIIFAGLDVLQNEKTGKCTTKSGFILKDGSFTIYSEENKRLFKYTNLSMSGKPIIGSFVSKCQCEGHYFGIIKGDDPEVKVWAKESIEEMETLINKQGLSISKKTVGKREYVCCNIVD